MMSSNRLKVSGAGCSSDTRIVNSSIFAAWCKLFMMENVVELSKLMEISSMNNARVGPTIISPVQENTHTKETKKDRMLCVYSSQVATANHMLKYKYCKKTHVMGDDVSSTSITLM
jgi:hypothetical protein